MDTRLGCGGAAEGAICHLVQLLELVISLYILYSIPHTDSSWFTRYELSTEGQIWGRSAAGYPRVARITGSYLAVSALFSDTLSTMPTHRDKNSLNMQ